MSVAFEVAYGLFTGACLAGCVIFYGRSVTLQLTLDSERKTTEQWKSWFKDGLHLMTKHQLETLRNKHFPGVDWDWDEERTK